MSSVSDKLYNTITEAIYGDEYTKHDKQNVKKKFAPSFNGEAGLTIRCPLQSRNFLEMISDKCEQIDNLWDKIATLKGTIKHHKNNPIPKEWLDKYSDMENTVKNTREEMYKIQQDKIDDYNTHPYCMKLLERNNELENRMIKLEKDYTKKEAYVESKRLEYLKKAEEYSELHQELDEEFKKKERSFIAKAKKENKDEESVKMKALREELQALKKKHTKLEKKHKSIKKENKQLRIQVAEMSSESDTDSDNDSD